MRLPLWKRESWSFSPKIFNTKPQPNTSSTPETSDNWHREDSKTQGMGVPDTQNVLLLHGAKQDYAYVESVDIPALKSNNDVLLRTRVIGLNPIDWKGPAFNFGLPPELPCISGRELVGTVVKTANLNSRLKPGDVVLTVSTDYRDSRKGAFQEYAIAYDFNSARIPRRLDMNKCAPIGVGFVTAFLALGICLGLDFTKDSSVPGPDLLKAVRAIPESELPEDIRDEVTNGIGQSERPQPGDWLAIWGASSTVGFIALQLAKRAGLKVICVVDAVKHGSQLVESGADVLVHRKDTEEAVSIIRAVTKNNLKYGLDAVGKDTAALLQSALKSSDKSEDRVSHLTGLTGLPKEKVPGVIHHKVPIKLFHEREEIGTQTVRWLEDLLSSEALQPPKTLVRDGGLKGINDALRHLRSGECQAQRIVVPV